MLLYKNHILRICKKKHLWTTSVFDYTFAYIKKCNYITYAILKIWMIYEINMAHIFIIAKLFTKQIK